MALKKSIDEVRRDDDRLTRCKEAGWLQDGAMALNPQWVYFGWDPKLKKQVVTEQKPLPTSELLSMTDTLECYVIKEGQKGSGGRDALPPIWKCLLQASRVQTSLGAGSQAASGETPRAEIPGDLQLEAEGELAGSSVDLGRSIAPVPRAAREWARTTAKLSNPTGQNLCYANSCFQTWYWMSQLVDSASHIGGQVRPGYKSLSKGQLALAQLHHI